MNADEIHLESLQDAVDDVMRPLEARLEKVLKHLESLEVRDRILRVSWYQSPRCDLLTRTACVFLVNLVTGTQTRGGGGGC